MTSSEMNKKHRIKKVKEKSESLLFLYETKKIGLDSCYNEIIKLEDNEIERVCDTLEKGGKWYMYEYCGELLELWLNKKCTIKDADRVLSDMVHNNCTFTTAIKNLNEFKRQQRISDIKAKQKRKDVQEKIDKNKVTIVCKNNYRDGIREVYKHFKPASVRAFREAVLLVLKEFSDEKK